MTDFASMTSQ